MLLVNHKLFVETLPKVPVDRAEASRVTDRDVSLSDKQPLIPGENVTLNQTTAPVAYQYELAILKASPITSSNDLTEHTQQVPMETISYTSQQSVTIETPIRNIPTETEQDADVIPVHDAVISPASSQFEIVSLSEIGGEVAPITDYVKNATIKSAPVDIPRGSTPVGIPRHSTPVSRPPDIYTPQEKPRAPYLDDSVRGGIKDTKASSQISLETVSSAELYQMDVERTLFDESKPVPNLQTMDNVTDQADITMETAKPVVMETPKPVSNRAEVVMETPKPVGNQTDVAMETPKPFGDQTDVVMETPKPFGDQADVAIRMPSAPVRDAGIASWAITSHQHGQDTSKRRHTSRKEPTDHYLFATPPGKKKKKKQGFFQNLGDYLRKRAQGNRPKAYKTISIDCYMESD